MRSPKAIKIILKYLIKRSEVYNDAYEEVIKKIKNQIGYSLNLTKQVLLWIIYIKRFLIILKFRHVLVVEIGESEFNVENFLEIENIIFICAKLVIVNKESNIIRLIYYTAQEYFERIQKKQFLNAKIDIAKIYIIYLLFDIFEAGFYLTDEEFETRLHSNLFYDYTARNWGHHVRVTIRDVEKLILGFLKNDIRVSGCSQAIMIFKFDTGDSDYS